MNRQVTRKTIGFSVFSATTVLAEPALAHHVMGGRMPATFADGLLSGLGHPVIGLDHFAAVVAVGALAAAHRAGASLAIGFVMAMMAGVALYLAGTGLPGAEMWLALSVVALGTVMLTRRPIQAGAALALFSIVGLLHGYALGESIYGAEPTPLTGYLIGLAVIQSTVALAAMAIARIAFVRGIGVPSHRLVGAGIAGIGLAHLMQQIIPAV